jgi:hypothetical protein
MRKNEIGIDTLSVRTIRDFWPFMLWVLPIIIVYGTDALGYPHLCDKQVTDVMLGLPLLSIPMVSFSLLAWKSRNEFAQALAILSIGFFAREWHFKGTDRGVYVVIAFVLGWFIYRRDVMRALIKNTPVEIWLWATALCYVIEQMIERRVFGENHLNLLPMENIYEVRLEETTELMAHLMLGITSFVAWRQFGTANSKGKNNEQ